MVYFMILHIVPPASRVCALLTAVKPSSIKMLCARWTWLDLVGCKRFTIVWVYDQSHPKKGTF